MEIHYYEDIKVFKDLVTPFLLQFEVENNLLFGILDRLENNINTYSDTEEPIFITISKNNEIKLVSIRTPPHNQLLSFTKNLDAIKFLVEELAKKKVDLPGVMGFTEGSKNFARLWAKKRKLNFDIEMHERIYLLKQVNKDKIGNNTFCLATSDEKTIILNFLEAFIKEALPKTSKEEITRSQHRTGQAITNQKVYVLKVNDRITSMVKRAGETPNGQTINMVYTPPAHRGKGYATEVVAKVSQCILNEGKQYCFLFTDLANPTSNKIYQTVGYKPVIDIDVYRFKK